MGSKLQFSAAIAILATCLKLLLIPSYRSTDFEVHRNWLAITHSLPIKEWYFEDTSEWTVDYPPFFAYFERYLALFAGYFDARMLEVDNLDYASENTVLFMRLTVIATDLLLLYATWLVLTNISITARTHALVFALVAFNAGLLLVDHIHFQYNGILMGILVLCVYFARTDSYLLLAAAFSTLVLMKHLFVPLAPIFAVYLIQQHCFVPQRNSNNSSGSAGHAKKVFSVVKFLELAAVALAALTAAFGPFLLQSNGTQQLQQILSRLFPFGRGLVHAYWAPNVWALYCAADKLLFAVVKKANIPALSAALLRTSAEAGAILSGGNNSASGIVGDFAFAVLPSVSAPICLLLMGLTLLPAVWAVYKRPTPRTLLVCLVYASMCSFMYGYHVHEKAIIIPLLLQSFTLVDGDSLYEADLAVPTVRVAVKGSGDSDKSGGPEPAGVLVAGAEDKNTVEKDTASSPALRNRLRSRKGSAKVTTSATPDASEGKDSRENTGERRDKSPGRARVRSRASGAEGSGDALATTTTADSATAPAAAAPVREVTSIAAHKQARLAQDLFLNKALLGLLATAGVAGLFPLFFTQREVFTKGAIYAAYVAAVWYVLFSHPSSPHDHQHHHPEEDHYNQPRVHCEGGVCMLVPPRSDSTAVNAGAGEGGKEDKVPESRAGGSQWISRRSEWFLKVQLGLCLFCMVVVFLFAEVVHPVLFRVRDDDGDVTTVLLPFLPRLLTSVVCALYLAVAWVLSLVIVLRHA